MVHLLSILTTAILASSALAAPGNPHHRRPKGPKGGKGGAGAPAPPAAPPAAPAAGNPVALYFQTNKAGNMIVAVPVGADGTLSAGTLTPTGGDGGNLVDPATGNPNALDPLASQGSVRVAGNVCLPPQSHRPTR
jgi:hypothetical protein